MVGEQGGGNKFGRRSWHGCSTLGSAAMNVTANSSAHSMANAHVSSDYRPDEKTQIVDFVYRIQKGQLVHIGRIDIRGNRSTRDKVIRRELKISEGELYSCEETVAVEKKTNSTKKYQTNFTEVRT